MLDYKKLVTLWLEGESTENIAKALGVTKSTVTNNLNKLRKAGCEIPKRTVRINPKVVDEINAMLKGE